ncbi:uncharacterized protein BT62DRAFT_1077142 [Guyanagaster necrorhizus]|uniref:Uncharacterized protein n=1 Tax=Guyanagaster necrorhizus TaxID=856835 RepID=A0A9P7VQU3_9AGAR|nr:uncharacterized protein BT62DRAFT_1077142 [Guyanagaster necrorhizus MCA 3950]KAG7444912.1 hypothetical protein BT62DRAFT_1077142 [Guyanagaster necrorhizus MCA 3950]
MPSSMNSLCYKDSVFPFPQPDYDSEYYPASKTVRLSSCTRYMERRVVKAWKKITGLTKKQHRASFLPPNFVFVTPSAKRRSIRYVY